MAASEVTTVKASTDSLRNAMPRPAVSRIGKKIAQKMASGSRTNSRIRTSVSWMSGCPSRVGTRARTWSAPLADVSFIAQVTSREEHEDVLQRGRMGTELGQRDTLAPDLLEQRGQHALQVQNLYLDAAVLGARPANTLHAADSVQIDGARDTSRWKLHEVAGANRGDECTWRIHRDHFPMV